MALLSPSWSRDRRRLPGGVRVPRNGEQGNGPWEVDRSGRICIRPVMMSLSGSSGLPIENDLFSATSTSEFLRSTYFIAGEPFLIGYLDLISAFHSEGARLIRRTIEDYWFFRLELSLSATSNTWGASMFHRHMNPGINMKRNSARHNRPISPPGGSSRGAIPLSGNCAGTNSFAVTTRATFPCVFSLKRRIVSGYPSSDPAA
mmetsp:Transcript_10593/g.21343  ORF Transcript_10593/g.21343 Transcript_10593/m.21343 type:complete len:203 (+) Transcript_10593:1610-2218(+)